MVGRINISGQIGSWDEEKGIELIDVISQVRKQPEATSFEVYINSEGGIVETGFDIFNFLKSLGLPVTTIGDGMVASIATVIFMAGHKRLVKPNTQFMIHLPMGGISFATAEEMEDHSKHLRDVEGKVIGFYTKELNLNKEAIAPLLKNETWLTEQQLSDLGFVTANTDLKIAATANKNSKNKKQHTMSKKNRLQTILKAIFDKEVNKMIFTADEQELMFPDLAEDAVIEVGARATLAGQPVGGTEEAPVNVVGQDGKTYVFVDSVVKEIVDPASEDEDDVTTDELVEALAATLEYTAELSGRVEAIETEVTGMRKERDEAVSKLKIAEATIAKLKGSSKGPDTDPKDKDKKKETISATVAQWRKNKTTNNKK
jgi:ATP-dependent protease ClpP protease subunit